MNRRNRILQTAAGAGLALGALTVMAATLTATQFVALKGLIVLTFFYAGKFVVLLPALEREVPFSPYFLAGMVALMDVVTALVVGANLDLLYRTPWAGPRLADLEENGRRMLRARPWLGRLATAGVAVFVMFPLTGTGAIGGTLFGRLIGLRPAAILGGIAAGAIFGSYGMAAGADALAGLLEPIRHTTWFRALGLAVVAGFAGVLVWQGMRMRTPARVEPVAKPE